MRVHEKLLESMALNEWPATFSIGMITCLAPPKSVDELLKIADDLMYSVKRSGKNSVRHDLYAVPNLPITPAVSVLKEL